jgi:hypothetical protein
MKKKFAAALILNIVISQILIYGQGSSSREQTSKPGIIKIHDHKGGLVLTLDCNNRCVLSKVETLGRAVVSKEPGVFSTIRIGEKVFSTSEGINSPAVKKENNLVTVEGIVFGDQDQPVTENWIFRSDSDFVDWTIERSYAGNMTMEDTGFPEWSFDSMDTWTGALLGTGGVAWCKFFDRIDASLGSHTGRVVLWDQTDRSCLSIEPSQPKGQHVAVRFSRQPDERFTLNYSVSDDELRTKHFLSRFIIDRQDIWDAFDAMGKTSITYRLRALNYDNAYGRGDLKGISTESVRSVLNTIARVGVIDEKLMGSNNWHLDMGFVCLHEHWVAQMGLAIDDPYYTDNYRKTLDYFRDNAIGPDGDVKDRWAYRIWDSEPGTFENGFYECQWGDLLDANTDYVINVSELFQLNGDSAWVMTHKSQCEKALAFLLGRDSDNNGLIEVFAASHLDKKGSDWIDVIWASWENAFINAKLYYALTQWADVEEIAGDGKKAEYYRAFAVRCKERFNQPVSSGGFWDPGNKWYVYWRDKDGSVHGNNLVTPVNFMAIAYGICDDRTRKDAVLSRIENLMEKEKLFMWPISFFPYQPDEGLKVNYPFPNYENGDIFLAWGETGIRAYQDYDPAIPVKYIKNVLTQYEKDGLAFQRYQRGNQLGAGSDILANNCLPVVGLYRDIYGIRPQYDRLYLDPHMTSELNGTKINYRLRDQDYSITLSLKDYSVSANSFTVRSAEKFGINTKGNILCFFRSSNYPPFLKLSRERPGEFIISILKPDGIAKETILWKAGNPGERMTTAYEISELKANGYYSVIKNGKNYLTIQSDQEGKIHFTTSAERNSEDLIEIRKNE